MSRMSLLTLTDQKFLSFALSSLWKLIPGLAGFIWRSKAVVLTAFCSSPVNLARLSGKVSAMRNSITVVIRAKNNGSVPTNTLQGPVHFGGDPNRDRAANAPRILPG